MLLAKVTLSVVLGLVAMLALVKHQPVVVGACVVIWAVVMGQSKEGE